MKALINGLLMGLGAGIAALVGGLTGVALFYLGIGVMFTIFVISERR